MRWHRWKPGDFLYERMGVAAYRFMIEEFNDQPSVVNAMRWWPDDLESPPEWSWFRPGLEVLENAG